ncbi:hypothetical protein C8Q77DRAFT_1212139 [Trametes polyzona]|nr:hypothetical protein C8Q77DRAFT_1212139 [Trametes polyzona]
MARSGPGSSQQRPRRAKGNYNPAEPVLKLKILRRASAEVAQERAAAEARRQEILRQHEEDLRALAELEAKLKEQDEQAALDAARPPSQTLLTTVLKTTGNARTSPPSQADCTTHGHITPTPPLGDATKAGADYNGGYGDDETPEQVEADRRALQPVTEHVQAVTERTLAQSSVQVTKVVAKPAHVKDKAPNDVATVKAPVQSASPSSGPAEPVLDCATSSNVTLQLDNSVRDTSDAYTIFQPVTTPLTKPPGRKWRMEDLVPILGPFIGSFKLRFIPNLIFFLGNLSSGPWHTYGVDLVGVMRTLAKEVWPQLKYIVIEPKQPFYELAKQKLTDYRNSVATTAIEVVNRFMNSRRFRGSPQKRAEWVQWALSAEKWYPFRYGYVEERPNMPGKLRHARPYQGKLVIQTFAHHLRRVQRRAHQVRDHPCNALALVTTAVERAIKLWESGELGLVSKDFSERTWRDAAHEYMASIINLTDEEWDKILQLADDYACGRAETDTDDDVGSNDGNFEPRALPSSGGRAMLHDSDAEWDWSDDGGDRFDSELTQEDASEASTGVDEASDEDSEVVRHGGQDTGYEDGKANGRTDMHAILNYPSPTGKTT